jgi:hypothetical protein
VSVKPELSYPQQYHSLPYIAELRKLTEFCEFGLNLNDTLRDRFVCGLRNDQIQKKLLTIREFSLDKALEIE